MSKIQLLSPELISRIAAGECVERPASVVKEIIENALDAGAGQIDVTIADGGRELIQIVDDGMGMTEEDLPMCVVQHATSKIQNDDDLFSIHTMGFRGEALASIGSVSRLQITSRTAESDVGHQIRVDGAKISDIKPVAAPIGTSVEVRDLFYAVPARRKFLKTTATEMGHITEQFARIALAHPGVGLSLKNNKRKFHDLKPTNNRLDRIRGLYGPELADVLWPVRRESNDVLVEGFVAPPQESRGSGKWEYVFVNGRYVRDRFISHAIKEAYRSLIDPRRYPVAFLFVTVDPEAIDVNVHPMKTEVRWRDSNFVHAQVLAALREKFLTSKMDHDFENPKPDEYRGRVRQAMVDYFTKTKPTVAKPEQGVFDLPQTSRSTPQHRPDTSAPQTPKPFPALVRPSTEEHADASTAPIDQPVSSSLNETVIKQSEKDASTVEPPVAVPGPTMLRVVSDRGGNNGAARAVQIHNSYIVAETEEGMMVIDQHALHERILYEGLCQRVKAKPLESQRLLLPEVVRVPADRIEVLEEHAEMLDRLGIELNAVGPQSVALQAFPTLLLERGVNQHNFIADLLDKLSEPGTKPDTDTLVHEVLDMMACKAAVKAGDPLTQNEIEALIERRELAERASHCPHGRPTTLHMTLKDLEKQFHR